MTYLMWRAGMGFRIGTTRTWPKAGKRPVSGVQLRTMQEHADAAWVISTHQSEGQARAEELVLSLKYGLPTIPFVARNGNVLNGLVANQSLIDEIFTQLDTEAGASDFWPTWGSSSTTHTTHPAAMRGGGAM